jgi:hypothetical protein
MLQTGRFEVFFLGILNLFEISDLGFRISIYGGLSKLADHATILLSSSMFVLRMHIFGEPIRCPLDA